MRWLALVIVTACGAPDRLGVPDDHALHDLSTRDAGSPHWRLAGNAMAVAELRAAKSYFPLPISGTADLYVDILVPGNRLDHALGTAELRCTACRLGDDVAKIELDDPTVRAFANEGIQFGHVTIDRLAATLSIVDGRVELASWDFASPDVDLAVALEIDLAPSWESSQVRGCVRYKVRDALQSRDPRTADVLALTGAPLGEDGYFHVTLDGTVGKPRRLGKICNDYFSQARSGAGSELPL